LEVHPCTRVRVARRRRGTGMKPPGTPRHSTRPAPARTSRPPARDAHSRRPRRAHVLTVPGGRGNTAVPSRQRAFVPHPSAALTPQSHRRANIRRTSWTVRSLSGGSMQPKKKAPQTSRGAFPWRRAAGGSCGHSTLPLPPGVWSCKGRWSWNRDTDETPMRHR
jgi:hypothetical protein